MIDERNSYEPVSAHDTKIMLITTALVWLLLVSLIICIGFGVIK